MITRIASSLTLERRAFLPLLLLLTGCSAAGAQTPVHHPAPEGEDPGTLRVTGQARISVPADQVRIAFAVESEASTASEAVRANARAMDGVLQAIRGLDRDDLRLETYGYNLHPDYARRQGGEPGGRTIVSYRAVNRVRVTVPEVEAAGAILDAATGAGANRVESLDFQATDTREARLRALDDAVRTAREEAEAIAHAMDVRLGPPLEVQGGASTPSPRPMGAGVRTMEAVAAPTPVEPGSQTVSASVTITFRLLEKGS
jgi:hypothetical protein